MKLTTLNIFLSLSTLVVGILPVDRTDQVDAEKLYVNPHGEVIIPQEFPWGRYVMKEKDAARNRTTCAGRMDPSGRLGKRQAVRIGHRSTLYMIADSLFSTVLLGSSSLAMPMLPVPAAQVTPPSVRIIVLQYRSFHSFVYRLLCWNCLLRQWSILPGYLYLLQCWSNRMR